MDRARRVAWELEAGFVAINGQVASDCRLAASSGQAMVMSGGLRHSQFVNTQIGWPSAERGRTEGRVQGVGIRGW